jgi:hypothetical protein
MQILRDQPEAAAAESNLSVGHQLNGGRHHYSAFPGRERWDVRPPAGQI